MKKIASAFLGCLIFSSCAPSTPQARIERDPAKFAALPKREQTLVQQGQIARGMSPDAVVLAWGPPSRRFEGSRNSVRTERWDYSGSSPVYSHFYGGLGYGRFGPYDRHGYSSLGFATGPEVTYIPYHVASVWFVNQRVDSWERAQ